MEHTYSVQILPGNRVLTVRAGEKLLQALRQAQLAPDAPCGGRGTCGKCKVTVDGAAVLACQQTVDRDMTVTLPQRSEGAILTGGLSVDGAPDGAHRYVLAFDIGTTTVVCYLLSGSTGEALAQASCRNPQAPYGADVISRLQYAAKQQDTALRDAILDALARLTHQAAASAGITAEEITLAAVVGNTAMHHLLLNLDPAPLLTPPYMPQVRQAMVLPARELLPIAPEGLVRVLPIIAGFVGADTLGCLTATRFDQFERLTLLIDIGTNGEMVLGDKTGFLACSTAAGPAFEGANISCGMQGTVGAVDRVWLEDGEVGYHVIGEGEAAGLCGSGLLDLVAVLLETGEISGSGRMKRKGYRLGDSPVVLTQQDVRQVQLAKAAIRAGIELLCQQWGRRVEEIEQVLLAGAFGSSMDPASACRIGMIPPCLEAKIQPIGNAAGVGAQLCALSSREFAYSQALAGQARFLELASLPQFQACYVAHLDLDK